MKILIVEAASHYKVGELYHIKKDTLEENNLS